MTVWFWNHIKRSLASQLPFSRSQETRDISLRNVLMCFDQKKKKKMLANLASKNETWTLQPILFLLNCPSKSCGQSLACRLPPLEPDRQRLLDFSNQILFRSHWQFHLKRDDSKMLQSKILFEVWKTTLRNRYDENALKRKWLSAFAGNNSGGSGSITLTDRNGSTELSQIPVGQASSFFGVNFSANIVTVWL